MTAWIYELLISGVGNGASSLRFAYVRGIADVRSKSR